MNRPDKSLKACTPIGGHTIALREVMGWRIGLSMMFGEENE